ncbi:MAG: fatty acid desaturase [Gemmatimonadaceae bacterium]|nr:fatty acid desaturase [Acetobacteraceae bacterium]
MSSASTAEPHPAADAPGVPEPGLPELGVPELGVPELGVPQPGRARVPGRHLLRKAASFQSPVLAASLWQFLSTGGAYAALLVVMYFAYSVSVWLSLALVLPAAGLVVRLFIIQHDCGHGAFFQSRRANLVVGVLCSLATLTPFTNWRRHHAQHHSMWNNLDQRDMTTDIYSTCLTVEEYAAMTPTKKWFARTVRHPLIAHFIIPPIVFLILYRVPFETPLAWTRERRAVWLTNAGIAAGLVLLVLAFGIWPVLLVQVPVIAVAAIIGVWLFSIQHRFEDAHWSRGNDWSAVTAAISGSSFLKLPAVLRWFSGNIGYHHVHHLVPRVPNYRLRACHEACEELFGTAQVLTLRDALMAPSYALFDESTGRMVRFPSTR